MCPTLSPFITTSPCIYVDCGCYDNGRIRSVFCQAHKPLINTGQELVKCVIRLSLPQETMSGQELQAATLHLSYFSAAFIFLFPYNCLL